MEAHVIMANDSVEHVFIGPIELAERKREELAEAAFADPNRGLRFHYDKCSLYTGATPYEKYRNHVYWHIHTVSMTDATIEHSGSDPQIVKGVRLIP